MPADSGDRSKFFPAIEKKHGKPVAFFLKELSALDDNKYPAQISLLREKYEFSQTHANAVVMYLRGSTSSKRFSDTDQYFQKLGAEKEAVARQIFAVMMKKYPKLELCMAWNKPTLRLGDQYVIGLESAKNHFTVLPFGSTALIECADKLADYEVLKKTFKVPADWKPNATLLNAIVKARLDEIKNSAK